MSQVDALHQNPGKTIQGVVLKKNDKLNLLAVSLLLVFTDETCYKTYSLYQLIAQTLAPFCEDRS